MVNKYLLFFNVVFIIFHLSTSTVFATTKISATAISASTTQTGSSLAHVTDGNASTAWSTGLPAPQWILMDLGKTTTLNQIRLLPNQMPLGQTIHTIQAGATPDSLQTIFTLNQFTYNNVWITIPLLLPVPNVRYVKIATSISPSWISWREIELYEGSTSANTHVRYFGYLSNDYWYQSPTYFNELRELGNTNIAWANVNLNQFAVNGIQVLYSVTAFFYRPKEGPNTGRLVLNPQWELLWQQEKTQKIDPYIDTIYGFYLDEPFWNGTSKADFQTFVQAVRSAYPDKALLILEAAPSVTGHPQYGTIPAGYYDGVTDIGFDYYFVNDSSTNEEGWKKYLTYLELFKPYFAGKKFWVVPDGYGSGYTRWADAYERYVSLVLTHEQGVGLLGFIYNLPSELLPARYSLRSLLIQGNDVYSPSFRARQIEIGKAIIANTSPSPSPSSLPVKPGDANGDNKVDGVDYVVWLNHYNQNVTGTASGDYNNSGKVDGVDYIIWVNGYGK